MRSPTEKRNPPVAPIVVDVDGLQVLVRFLVGIVPELGAICVPIFIHNLVEVVMVAVRNFNISETFALTVVAQV
jgi:hypothetical protein